MKREADAAYVSADGWATAGIAGPRSPGGLFLDGKPVEWGPVRMDHQYTYTLTGADQPLVLQLYDADGRLDDNGGHLQVSLFRVGSDLRTTGAFPSIPEVLCVDGPPWMEPRGFSGAASVVMVAAALGRLPAWPTWVDSDEADTRPGDPSGWQTDWGQYLGAGFHFPGEEAFTQLSLDPSGAPVAGVGGALGPDVDATERLSNVLTRLGMRLEIRVAPSVAPLEPDMVLKSLQQAAQAEWPTILAVSLEKRLRFVVVTGFDLYEDRLELSVWDPERHVDRGDPVRYRLATGVPVRPPHAAGDVPELEGVMGIWSVSSPEGPGIRLNDFLLDDSTPWFALRSGGQTWGHTFDFGLGAPGRSVGSRGWGLTWVEASGSKKAQGEAGWRVIAPESGRYNLWAYIPPGIDPSRLIPKMEYFLTGTQDEPLKPEHRIGEVLSEETADSGWHVIGTVLLTEEEESFVRMPIVGARGKRIILDGIWVVKE